MRAIAIDEDSVDQALSPSEELVVQGLRGHQHLQA
jgi:hypothetical protein